MNDPTVSHQPDRVHPEQSAKDVRAAIDARPESTRRVSHRELMKAAEWLRKAYDKERAAGELARAMEINQLILHAFMAAIRVEDIPFEPTGGAS